MEIVRPIEVIETEINFYKQQTATGIIEIGKRLIEAKAQLQHGEWGKWLEEKVDFSIRTAQMFMRISNEYSNTKSVSHLGYKKMWLLLDIPAEEREQFANDNNVAELTTRQLQEAIRLRKEAEQRASNEIKARNEALQELSKEKEKAWNTQLELDKLKLQQPKIVEKVVEKVVEKAVIPPDYHENKYKVAEINKRLESTNRELEQLKKYKEKTEQQAQQYERMQSEMNYLMQQKSDLGRKINATTELARLTVRLDEVLKKELAPIRFMRTMEVLDTEEIALKNLTEVVEMVETWCREIRKHMPNSSNIITII